MTPKADVRLRRAVCLVDDLVDAAHGKIAKPDIETPWLRVMAPDEYGGIPSDQLARWATVFSDEIKLVRRASNSVKFRERIGAGNVAAAADIAEQLVEAARQAGQSLLRQTAQPVEGESS